MKRALSLVAAVLALVTAGCTSAPAKPPPDFRPGPETIGDPYEPGQGNGGYDVIAYDLKLRYDPATGTLGGTATIIAHATQDLSRFTLDLARFQVSEVSVDGKQATATVRNSKLAITPATGIKATSRFTATVTYSGRPGGHWQRTADGAFAMGRPASAGDWFPVNDHPSDKATFALAMTVPDGLAAISIGVPGPRTAADGWTTWTWSENSATASYVMFVAIGHYRITTTDHGGLPLVTAVPESLPPGSPAAQSVAQTGAVADYLATQFGPYPFDAYGGVVLSDPRAVYALETQTRPVYSDAAFRNGPNTTVVARELSYQWFGNYVTLRRWQDIWLDAGFATYGEWLWQAHLGRQTLAESFDRCYDGFDWSRRADDPGQDGLFGQAVSQRGGMALYALRREMGATLFGRLIRTWPHEHRNANATTEDFILLAEQISGRNLDPFFRTWLYGTQPPAHP
jgi:aminopeptidase N